MPDKPSFLNDTVLRNKKRIKILLLGPYSPPKAEKRLQDVKDYLIGKGYQNTRLVKDWDKGKRMRRKDIFKKSRKLMSEWADVLFFFFFKESLKDGKLMGVHDELATVCESFPELLERCVVFIDKRIEKNLSMMFGGRLDFFELKCGYFETDAELQRKAGAYSYNYLITVTR